MIQARRAGGRAGRRVDGCWSVWPETQRAGCSRTTVMSGNAFWTASRRASLKTDTAEGACASCAGRRVHGGRQAAGPPSTTCRQGSRSVPVRHLGPCLALAAAAGPARGPCRWRPPRACSRPLSLAAAAGLLAACPRPQEGRSGVRISKLAGTLAHDRVRAGFGVHTNIRGELVIHNLGSAMLKPVLCQGGCLR